MNNHIQDCGIDREAKMVALERDAGGKNTVWCDPCIAPIVKSLNDGGVKTVASCCGHGHRPAWIALEGDRHILIMSRSEMYRVDALFPADINGQTRDEDSPEEVVRCLGEYVELAGSDKLAMVDTETLRGALTLIQTLQGMNANANGHIGELSNQLSAALTGSSGGA